MSETLLMRKMGLEPTRRDRHKILSLARLPIPTLPRTDVILANHVPNVNRFFRIFKINFPGSTVYVNPGCTYLLFQASLLFASSARAAKPSASFTAISARTLRFRSTSASLRPYINLL